MTPSCFWPAEKIAEARAGHLAALLPLLAERHAWYRRATSVAGIDPAEIREPADLARLPVITKQDFMDAPRDFELDTSGLGVEEQTVWDVMYTTGSTTGEPTRFVSTSYDFYNILTLNLNMMALRAVRDDDVIANLFPLTQRPHGAFTRAQQAAAVRNIPVVAALPGNPSPHFRHSNRVEGAVRIVERTRATILWGVPSFIRRLLQAAGDAEADFSAVRMVFVTGEALYPAAQDDLRDRLARVGAASPVISGSYGLTEMQGGLVECQEGAGFHNPLPDQILIDVVDPETHTPLAEGEEGLVTLTHLNRRGTVLLRYLVGDISTLSRRPCPHCGATTERLVTTPRRADALVKIKGMLVNPDPVAAALAARQDLAGYRLTVSHVEPGDALSGDVFRLTVAPAPGTDIDEGALLKLVKAETGVTPVIETVSAAEFAAAETSWKSKTFQDLRGTDG